MGFMLGGGPDSYHAIHSKVCCGYSSICIELPSCLLDSASGAELLELWCRFRQLYSRQWH